MSYQANIKLNCHLFGNKIYRKGNIVKAVIHVLTDNNHVLEIAGERFGVFAEHYKLA